MTKKRVLIKFFSPQLMLDVIPALAYMPDRIIFAGDGEIMTDEALARIGAVLEARRIPSSVEKAALFKNVEAACEMTLREILDSVRDDRTLIDISGIDPVDALALGRVLDQKNGRQVSVVRSDAEQGIFFPVIAPKDGIKLSFPSLTFAELRHLRHGTPFDEEPSWKAMSVSRADLTPESVAAIRNARAGYDERPAFYRSISMHLSASLRPESPDQTEFFVDPAYLNLRREEIEALEKIKGFSVSIQGRVARVAFANKCIRDLLTHLDRIPLFEIMLQVARVTNIRGKAAYHNLEMIKQSVVIAVKGCLPLAVSYIAAEEKADFVYRFATISDSVFEEPVRRILVAERDSLPDAEILEACRVLGTELVSPEELPELLRR